MGGTVVLVIIVVFIVIVSGYMAFNVNYTKAFRVKNKVVDSFNKYGDICKTPGSPCDKEITEYAKSVGYGSTEFGASCDGKLLDDSDLRTLHSGANGLYCYAEFDKVVTKDDATVISDGEYHYYTIITKVDINIPLIEDSLGLRYLTVRGDTKTFKK